MTWDDIPILPHATVYNLPPVRLSRTDRLEIARWRLRHSKGRHARRNGRKPRPAGPIWEWHLDERGMGWGRGPGLRHLRRARSTIGFKKPKRRRWHSIRHLRKEPEGAIGFT